jgi:predicted dehydrogenase
MNDSVGIGVIGSGGMGMSVVAQVLAADERLRMRAVYDIDERSVENALKKGHADANVCSSLQELVNDPGIDWVMIATWNRDHANSAITALEAGKNVFCQKPLATTLEDCLRMRDAWKASGKLFQLGFNLRYSPHYVRIHELVERNSIGSMISMEFNETLEFNHGGFIMADWRRLKKDSGPHVLEKCCHDIDLVNWIVGSPAVRVASFGGLDFYTPEYASRVEEIGPNAEGKVAYSAWPMPEDRNPFTCDKDIIDNQVVIIEYANGVRATFHMNNNAGIQERRMYLCGTHGSIRADVLTGAIDLKAIGWDTETQNHSTTGQGSHGVGDEVLAQELAESMINGAPPRVGIEEGILSAVTCFAIDDAMVSGTVVDVRPYWERAGIGI